MLSKKFKHSQGERDNEREWEWGREKERVGEREIESGKAEEWATEKAKMSI